MLKGIDWERVVIVCAFISSAAAAASAYLSLENTKITIKKWENEREKDRPYFSVQNAIIEGSDQQCYRIIIPCHNFGTIPALDISWKIFLIGHDFRSCIQDIESCIYKSNIAPTMPFKLVLDNFQFQISESVVLIH